MHALQTGLPDGFRDTLVADGKESIERCARAADHECDPLRRQVRIGTVQFYDGQRGPVEPLAQLIGISGPETHVLQHHQHHIGQRPYRADALLGGHVGSLIQRDGHVRTYHRAEPTCVQAMPAQPRKICSEHLFHATAREHDAAGPVSRAFGSKGQRVVDQPHVAGLKPMLAIVGEIGRTSAHQFDCDVITPLEARASRRAT